MEHPPITLTFNRAAALHGHSLPEEARMARVAARKAFVEMKQSFMRAAAEVEGEQGRELQLQIRQATEVTELWRVRRALFLALPKDTARGNRHRGELRQHLDSAFPEAGPDTAFTPL